MSDGEPVDDPVDDSMSEETIDESTLLPLGESAGVQADDPEQDHDGDHAPMPPSGFVDDLPPADDEVQGEDVLPGADVTPGRGDG